MFPLGTLRIGARRTTTPSVVALEVGCPDSVHDHHQKENAPLELRMLAEARKHYSSNGAERPTIET